MSLCILISVLYILLDMRSYANEVFKRERQVYYLVLIDDIKYLVTKYRSSTPLRIENPENKPIVPPIAPN